MDDETRRPCPDCNAKEAQRVLGVHGGTCQSCAVRRYSKGKWPYTKHGEWPERWSLCDYCFKKLVPIGTARANGAQHHVDWEGRRYHKKCWRELQDD